MGSVELRGAVHDVYDADYFREGLCWVLYDDVVNC